jgi:Ca-activated chloride channel homolog
MLPEVRMTRVLLVAAAGVAGCGSSSIERGSAPTPPAEPTRLRSSTKPAPLGSAATAHERQKVLLVTLDGLYLESMLMTVDVIAKTLTPAEYERDPRVATTVNVVIFDDYTPPALPPPPTSVIAFHPAGSNSPIAIRGEVENPRITDTDQRHPIMRWVTLSEVRIDKSAAFAVDATRGESMIAASQRDTIIAATCDRQRKLIAFGFSLASTDLPLRVAFPTLISNTLGWFANSSRGCD